jgi:hypothetical protein
MSLIALAEKLEAKYPELIAEGQHSQSDAIGSYLANVCKFLLGRMPPDKRARSISTLKQKLYALDDIAISQKHMGGGAPIGQAITLVKSVLHGVSPTLIRQIINSIVAHL